MYYLLGIDAGGSVAKSAIFDTVGNEIACAGYKMDILCPGKGRNERDMEHFKNQVFASIQTVITKSGIDPGKIAAIGVTGQANGLFMLDKDGLPFQQNAILSSDTRAKDLVKKWNTDGTLSKLLPKTRQLLWPGQTTALIAWFSQNSSSTLEQAKTFLCAKDYVRYLLTGRLSLERTEASALSAMDLTTGTFTADIFKALGISEYLDKFPDQILDSTQICGYITKEAASITGLKLGTPVVSGLIDTIASVIASGIVDESMIGLIVGTWGVNTFITQKPIISDQIFSAFPYCLPDYNLILEGSSTSASNLNWYIDKFMKNSQTNFDFNTANSMVEESDYKSSIFFLPFLYGSNVNIDAKSAFIGLKGRHDPADLLRAIYEGIVFCHAYHINNLCQFREMPSTVRIAGGGSQSDVWMQMFADVLGVTVEVSTAHELGALGAAMAAGVGASLYSDMRQAATTLCQVGRIFTCDPKRHVYYQNKYRIYKDLIHALDPLWESIDLITGQ